MAENQRATIAFLSDPSSYGPGFTAVDRHETHISMVFLAADRAYKLKRAVTYAHLDFSGVEKRKRACETELALNRHGAPNCTWMLCANC